MKNRKVTSEEKTLYQKSIRRNQDIVNRANTRLREIEHLLTEGLYLTYLEKKEEFEAKKKLLCQTITESQFIINIAYSHLKDGIPQKEESKEEKL